MPSYCPPPKLVPNSCGVCGDYFTTPIDRVTGKPENYLCPTCFVNMHRDPLVEGVELNQEVDELLQEAEDHFNGVVRPKKIKEKPVEQPQRDPWTGESMEAKDPIQELLEKQDPFSNKNQGSQSQNQSQSPKKNHDWWKILGIIFTTAVLTAFFTTLFRVL